MPGAIRSSGLKRSCSVKTDFSLGHHVVGLLGSCGRIVTATPQGMPLVSPNLKRSNIEVSCTASATPDALSTFVLECYLQGTGLPGGRYDVPTNGGLPGVADTTVGARLDVPTQTYDVCMVARGVFRGGADGDIITTRTICL